VADEAVNPAQEVEQRQTEEPQGAVVDGQFQVGRDVPEAVDIFRARIEVGPDYRLFTGGHLDRRAGEAEEENILVGQLAEGVAVDAVRIGNPGADEVVLHHGQPAAASLEAYALVGDVIEVEFGVVFVHQGRR